MTETIKTIRAVIADDQPEFRSMLRKALESYPGISVVGNAQSGIEAITLTRMLRPHLVFLDISMPNMSGIEAAVRIKLDYPSIKVCFVTIHDEATYHALANLVDAEGYVNKNTLRSDIKVFIEKARKDL